MIQDFLSSLSFYKEAMTYLSRPDYRRYVWITGAVSALFALVVLGGSLYYVWDGIRDIIYAFQTSNQRWLGAVWTVIKNILPLAVILLIALTLYKNIIIIITAPFMSGLAAKIQQEKQGYVSTNASWGQFIQDNKRAIRINIRYAVLEIFYTVILLFISLLPVIGSLISVVGIFLVSAYYAGAGNIDFILELKRLSVKESIAFSQKNRGLCAGIGAGYLLILAIPLVGVIFAPTLSVTAATLSSLKRLAPSQR